MSNYSNLKFNLSVLCFVSFKSRLLFFCSKKGKGEKKNHFLQKNICIRKTTKNSFSFVYFYPISLNIWGFNFGFLICKATTDFYPFTSFKLEAEISVVKFSHIFSHPVMSKIIRELFSKFTGAS